MFFGIGGFGGHGRQSMFTFAIISNRVLGRLVILFLSFVGDSRRFLRHFRSVLLNSMIVFYSPKLLSTYCRQKYTHMLRTRATMVIFENINNLVLRNPRLDIEPMCGRHHP